MTDPVHHLGEGGKTWAVGQGGPIDHDDRQAKVAGGGQFGLGTAAAGVLGDHDLDAVVAHQGQVLRDHKGATRDHNVNMGQGQRIGRRVHQTEQIVVLGHRGKTVQVLTANGQKYPCGGEGQGESGVVQSRHLGPLVAGARLPGWPLESSQRQAELGAGRGGISAHFGGKGVGGVDHMADGFVAQIGGQARHTTKTANPLGQGLCHRIGSAAGIGKHGVDARIGQGLGKLAGLGRAAEQKDAAHG